ncbi:type IV secretory system conjugative DNA transfer family protein [Streptomyces alkaliterrae]
MLSKAWSVRGRRAGGKEVAGRRLYTARAELVLALPAHRPLAGAVVKPDPLQLVAAAMAQVDSARGESAEVVIDLVPISGDEVAARRRRLVRRGQRRGRAAYGEALGPGGGSAWEAVSQGLSGGSAGRGSAGRRPPAQRADLAEAVGKFVPGAKTVFGVQVLVRTVATHPARARARLHQVVAALEVGRGENRWRPVGPRRGVWRPYSNVWWRRWSFDRRFASGEVARWRRQWVTTGEIAAWLKPPSRWCSATNVKRCGGVLPPAPAELPTFTGQSGMVPLGRAASADGQRRLVAVPRKDVLFLAIYGRSGFGKTELALFQMICAAYDGVGVWMLDPHGAALKRARPYLAHPAVNARLWDIDLGVAGGGDMMAAWNPLSMEGRSLDDVPLVTGAVAGAIAAAQGWGDGAPRAYTIVSHAVQALTHLAWQMCRDGRPELQPTLFQVSTLLLDEQWRQAVVGRLPPKMRRWWRTVFPQHASDSVPVVTRLMDQLELSQAARAFLGSPRSTYNARVAMDAQRVVLLRPTGTGGADKLLQSMLIFDLFLAGLSREGADPASLRTMMAWVDELTAVDGAGRGAIAAILEQLRKYEVRFGALTQMALRLSEETRAALMQNQSLLVASGADADEAAFIAKRLPGLDPQTLVTLPKWQYVVSTMLHGRRTAPFRVQGVAVDQVLADYYNPGGLAEQSAAVDTNLRRRPVREIIAALEEHDDAILEYLCSARPGEDQPPVPVLTSGSGGRP